jgi:hypothetical protein
MGYIQRLSGRIGAVHESGKVLLRNTLNFIKFL